MNLTKGGPGAPSVATSLVSPPGRLQGIWTHVNPAHLHFTKLGQTCCMLHLHASTVPTPSYINSSQSCQTQSKMHVSLLDCLISIIQQYLSPRSKPIHDFVTRVKTADRLSKCSKRFDLFRSIRESWILVFSDKNRISYYKDILIYFILLFFEQFRCMASKRQVHTNPQ